MVVLRLAGGGRVAVRPHDLAVAQASPWGAVILLAGDGSKFEVQHDLEELRKLVPNLWFQADTTIFNPDHIVSIWEAGGALHYKLAGGLEMSQFGADLHQFMDLIEVASADRRAKGLD